MTAFSLIIKAVMPLKAKSLRLFYRSPRGLCCAASLLSKYNKDEVLLMVLCTGTVQILCTG